MSRSSRHKKKSKYIGSVRFFKHLILETIALMIIIPTIFSFYFGFSYSGLRKEVAAMANPAGPKVIEKMEEDGYSFLLGEDTVELSNPTVLYEGRVYLPAEEALKACGISDEEALASVLGKDGNIIYQDVEYISVNDLGEATGLWVTFSETSVSLYKIEGEEAEPTPLAVEGGLACLRLEDLMADPAPNSAFTHERLEKIRVLGRYLWSQGQEYSLAWIPLYTNPPVGVQNDLRREYSYYNADFIYTLDYLASHGGHVGLHGLTHQYGEFVSGIGNEFGPGSPFDEAEVRRRLLDAKSIAKYFGYKDEFFEFPHYVSTLDEEAVAEEYFSVLYQQKTNRRPLGKLETVQREDGKKVLYIPTPAGCVELKKEEGKRSILNALDSLKEKQLPSLFFHPYQEYDYISCTTTEGGQRRIEYSDDSIMHAILANIQSKGLQFQTAW